MADSSKIKEKDSYILEADPRELERLSNQHMLIKDQMGDKLVLAPIDLSQPDIRVLDSATADGLWLRDLYASLGSSPSHTYIGTDIAEGFFPARQTLPENISLHNQSMHLPFPVDWHSTFSLVHQRYGLAAAGSLRPREVVANLFTIVKPGGWIQLVEADFTDFKTMGPVMTRMHQLCMELFELMGTGSTYTLEMKGWLEEMCEEVGQEIVQVRLGKSHPDRKLGELGVSVMCQVAGMMVGLAQSVMETSFGSEELSTLVSNLKTELSTLGGSYKLHVVWGRKNLHNLR